LALTNCGGSPQRALAIKLQLEGEVIELTPSKTKPQGITRIKWTAFNQHGEPVYTFIPIGIVLRRPI
jgi:acyl dehydratase